MVPWSFSDEQSQEHTTELPEEPEAIWGILLWRACQLKKNIGDCDCDSLSVCKTDEAIIAMGPTRNVEAPMPHSPTMPPPTAVPCQEVIEPTETPTTTNFGLEARGRMREG